MKGMNVVYAFLFIMVVGADQLSKVFVVSSRILPLDITPFLTFDVAINRGLMSGLFHSTSWWPFIIINVIVIMFLTVFSFFAFKRIKEGCVVVGEVLVVAGAFSNVIDRLLRGGVIDFIKLHLYGFVWPIFNIADVCIVVGVGMMYWFAARKRPCIC